MQFNNLRHSRLTTVLSQWLIALFLLQILLPVQAHSRLATGRNGMTVVICTLQGERSVTLDLQHSNTQPSAAMLFSDLLADTTSILYIPTVPSQFLGKSQILSSKASSRLSFAEIDASSRAPPYV